jgi:hypothetical protein
MSAELALFLRNNGGQDVELSADNSVACERRIEKINNFPKRP